MSKKSLASEHNLNSWSDGRDCCYGPMKCSISSNYNNEKRVERGKKKKKT